MRGQLLIRLHRLRALRRLRVCGVIKQPGQGTHIVDGSHKEEDDANDVNGKDGSQEDQHDDLLEGERDERKRVTPLCVLKTMRGLTRHRKAQSPETQIRLETGSGSSTKAHLAPSQGVASSISDVQHVPEDLTE